jgi:hypothetical protein
MTLVDSVVLFGIEHSARCRFDAEHAEEIAGNHFRIYKFGPVIHAERSADEAAVKYEHVLLQMWEADNAICCSHCAIVITANNYPRFWKVILQRIVKPSVNMHGVNHA